MRYRINASAAVEYLILNSSRGQKAALNPFDKEFKSMLEEEISWEVDVSV